MLQHTAVKKALEAAGYEGEWVVLIVPTDRYTGKALRDVTGEMLKWVGMDVDYQTTDWGRVAQRRALTKPAAEGVGTSSAPVFRPRLPDPGQPSSVALQRNWLDDAKIEALREAWFNAPDLAAHKTICEEIQLQAFQMVPYWPLGLAHLPTAYCCDITGVLEGFPKFWNVRRT
jgi:peptide/nickel transport system substrate-binding protein